MKANMLLALSIGINVPMNSTKAKIAKAIVQINLPVLVYVGLLRISKTKPPTRQRK